MGSLGRGSTSKDEAWASKKRLDHWKGGLEEVQRVEGGIFPAGKLQNSKKKPKKGPHFSSGGRGKTDSQDSKNRGGRTF